MVELDKLEAGVNRALRRLTAAYPGRPLVILSPLAEGADRLIARCALALPGARLFVPLPLSLADYLEDFATAESRAEFHALLARAERVIDLPPAATRDAAYAAVGAYTLHHCDVLIALWDGREAQGQGGTGEIVAEARRRGMPLAWVRAGNRRPGTTEPTSLGEEQGRVTLERFPKRR
jgi:hypothetical protein